jgi:hypothetical protein
MLGDPLPPRREPAQHHLALRLAPEFSKRERFSLISPSESPVARARWHTGPPGTAQGPRRSMPRGVRGARPLPRKVLWKRRPKRRVQSLHDHHDHHGRPQYEDAIVVQLDVTYRLGAHAHGVRELLPGQPALLAEACDVVMDGHVPRPAQGRRRSPLLARRPPPSLRPLRWPVDRGRKPTALPLFDDLLHYL